MIWRELILLLTVLTVTLAQTSPHRTCQETDFCRSLRNKPSDTHEFNLITSWGVSSTRSSVAFNIRKVGNLVLRFNVSFVADDIIRLQMYELYETDRYFLDDVLDGDPKPEETNFHFLVQNENNLAMAWGNNHGLILNAEPYFSVEIYHTNVLVAVFNDAAKLTYDHRGVDKAISFDVNFPLAYQGYGLPLHADDIFLRQTGTGGEDPYRLFNINVENYNLNSTQALSGAVPMLYAYGQEHTVGLFLHNSYETWVDIDYIRGNLDAYFMAANGILDVFFMLGPTPADVYRQYTSLTGVTPLPPLWSMGFHYTMLPSDRDTDVQDLVANFDNYGFPIDAVWISEQAKSFVWDQNLFPGAGAMLQNITNSNRRLVLSVYPFITAEDGIFLFEHASGMQYLVLDPTRYLYIGDCFLGSCSWWDLTNPNALSYFKYLFSYESFIDTSMTVAGFWNAFNEPLVLNTEERIMPPDIVHFTGLSHKDVHNMYSHLMNEATYEGLLDRDLRQRRPFVLAESFFAGSQRYAAIATGTSLGTWEHLAASYRMCLSASIAGIPFCGTDVGGNTGSLDEELLVRWYQTAIWLPLFRSFTLEEGRQPYRLSQQSQDYIRLALRRRYSLTHTFYTLFYEHQRFNRPVIRPLFFQYPSLLIPTNMRHGFLVGNDILVYPITQSSISSLSIYLPPQQVWFDLDRELVYIGSGTATINVYPDRVPVFYRGGSIVAMRNGEPKTTVDLAPNSFTVYVLLNEDSEADGYLYVDDGISYRYQSYRQYNYFHIEYRNGVVNYGFVDADAYYENEPFVVSQYLLYRVPGTLKSTDGTPDSVTPEVYNAAADGTPLKDISISPKRNNIIKLR